MDYQWDYKKADINKQKHGIDFADAVGVFEDECSLTIKQEIIRGEQRFATVGVDFLCRIIVVVYTYRGNDIRLISARSATKAERNLYEQRRI
jgi:uncharacterized DUF497 family protein